MMKNMLLAHDHSELDSGLVRVFSAIVDGEVEQSFNHLDFFWARLAMHIRAENVHLFPTLLRAAERPERGADVPVLEVLQAAIARLRDDHDFFMNEITAAVKELRELRRGQRQHAAAVFAEVRERLTEVSRRLETHNAIEETEVYLWAGVFLDGPEQNVLVQNIQRELDNFPPRYRNR